jgi:twitching motility protein PilT
VLDDDQRAALARHGQIDLAYTLPGRARFRANVFRQQRGLDAVFRSIPSQPPTLVSLGLPESLARLADYHQGMVLITGPSGCGKSSTLAALINVINETRSDHIVCVEDPIEYVHVSRRAIVNQRQVGPHTSSFARAMRAALREDPDVIAIGELRDLETIELAITAAETGHLVLGTLHTNNAIRTINRMLGVFPPSQQPQMRTMISESLRAVVSQRLLARADGRGRVAALEVLIATKAVSSLIRDNKTFQIRSVLQTGAAHGMIQLDVSLAELVRGGVVTREEALLHVEDPAKLPV